MALISPTIPQQSHSYPTADDVGQENDSPGPDLAECTYNNTIFFKSTLSHSKNQISQNPERDTLQAGSCFCDPGKNVGRDPIISQEAGIGKHNQENPRLCRNKGCGTAVGPLGECGEPPLPLEGSASPATLPTIHAKAYKPLDVPELTPCFVCGAPWSHPIGEADREPEGTTERSSSRYGVSARPVTGRQRRRRSRPPGSCPGHSSGPGWNG